MKLRRTLAIMGTTAVLVTSFSGTALAAPPTDNSSHSAEVTTDEMNKKQDPRKGDWRYDPSVTAPPAESSLTGTTLSEDGLTPMYLEFSPAGCYGQTDMAHQGGSGWVEASVHGRTVCKYYAVNQVGVTTSLQKQGWLYWETMQTGTSSRVNSSTSYDATPHWNCYGWGSQNYRGISYHWSQEPTGSYGSETTGLEHRFGC
jgi:hypothetical protein